MKGRFFHGRKRRVVLVAHHHHPPKIQRIVWRTWKVLMTVLGVPNSLESLCNGVPWTSSFTRLVYYVQRTETRSRVVCLLLWTKLPDRTLCFLRGLLELGLEDEGSWLPWKIVILSGWTHNTWKAVLSKCRHPVHGTSICRRIHRPNDQTTVTLWSVFMFSFSGTFSRVSIRSGVVGGFTTGGWW